MSDLISRQQPVARGTNVLSNDTIYRQAAIDTLADMHSKSDEDGYVWIIRSDAWARIDALPSAQPEVIRCKDCKWYNDRERMCNDLMGFGRYWKPDDFCSYGKRRTDEQT